MQYWNQSWNNQLYEHHKEHVKYVKLYYDTLYMLFIVVMQSAHLATVRMIAIIFWSIPLFLLFNAFDGLISAIITGYGGWWNSAVDITIIHNQCYNIA